jgi:hypothetical protein
MNNSVSEFAIDVAPYLRASWRRKGFIILIVGFALVVAGVQQLRHRPLYLASADVQLAQVWDEFVEDPNIVLEKVNGPMFRQRVSRRLGRDATTVNVTAERLESGRGRGRYIYLLRLSAQAARPENAVNIVQAAVAQLQEESNQRFTAALAVYTARATALEKQIRTAKENLATVGNPNAFYAEKLVLVTLEQQLAELEINNHAPQKTFPTALTEEIAPARQLPQTGIWRRLALNGLIGLAVAMLGSWLLEWTAIAAELRREDSTVSALPTAN